MDAKARVGPGDLGLELDKGTDAQLFKWLVACQLFGARIKQEIAADAFRRLDRAGVLTPRALADADWQRLVNLLDDGGYTRYDESAARDLIEIGTQVVERYDGRITTLRDGTTSKKDALARLQEFQGVGPKAAEIFLREIAPLWDL